MSDTTSATDASAITVYETFTISSPTAKSTATATATGTTSTSSGASATSTSRTIVTAALTPTYLLGPLTTTYTAPTNCSQAYWYSATDDVYDPIIGQTCANISGQISFTNENNCLPPVTKSTIIGSLVGDGSTSLSTSTQYKGYYSPGIACPAGYISTCAVQAGADGIQSALSGFQSFSFVYTATADETVVGCCPTGYACANVASTQMCQKIIPTTTQPLITCVNVSNSALSVSTTQFTLPTITTLSWTDTASTINLTTLSMLATMVQINFQASDLLPTSSSSLLSSSSATATGASDGSGSNHKTTTIAVATVIPCVAALAAAGLAWFWYRRRAKKRLSASYQAAQPTEPSEMYQSTEPSGIYYASGVPTEMSGDQARFEIAGTTPQYEMDGSDPRKAAHEMDAGDEIPRYRDNDEGHDGLK